MTLKELFEKIGNSDNECKTKIIATHKVTEPQKKLWQEYDVLITRAIELKKKAETAKKKFWNKVEGDLNEFDRNLHINTDKWLIEVHEDDCDNCEKQ